MPDLLSCDVANNNYSLENATAFDTEKALHTCPTHYGKSKVYIKYVYIKFRLCILCWSIETYIDFITH